jgi:hypothetical protein
MTDAAVISGDFCTFRHVQGRKVLQIVIEVPAEAAGAVFAKLGMPGSGEGIPVAVARLHSPAEPIAKTEAPKERRPFSELPYSQQAAMRGSEPAFSQFLQETDPLGWQWAVGCETAPGDAAAIYIRNRCDVTSRRNIIRGTPAGDQWHRLESEFFAWSRGIR